MKLSRKRPVAGPPKEAVSASAAEASGATKKGQTKISRFFSKTLLPSLSDKATKLFQEKVEVKTDPEADISADANEAPLPPDVIIENCVSDSDEVIERTPECADRFRSSRFCRLKKTSKASLSSLKSSSSLVTSTPTSNSSSISSSPPTKKRAKFESPVDHKNVKFSPVCERNYSLENCASEKAKQNFVDAFDKECAGPNLPRKSSKIELEKTPMQLSTPPIAHTVDQKSATEISEKERPLSVKYGRHRVVDLSRSNDRFGEVQMSLESDDSVKKKVKCILRGSWATTDLSHGDIVNLLNLQDALHEDDSDTETFVIDDRSGVLVVHPDHLLSGTSIVSSLFCMRKAVLNERFKGLEGNNRTMFVGTLVHVLLQECLRFESRTSQDVDFRFQQVLKMSNIRQDMLGLGMNEADVRQEVEPFLPHIVFFIEKYVIGRDVKVPPAAYSNTGGGGPQTSYGGRPPPPAQLWPGTVEAVKDIEENIWSPRLGIKGKVDITVQVKLHNRDKKGRLCKTLPLELKTGRPSGSAEHKGQVILYSMMMSERRADPETGLLLYLRTSSVQEVAAGINEMRGLVQLRNQLVCYLRDQQNLPEPINLKRACEQCAHLPVCAAQQKLQNTVPEAPHAMSELVPSSINHLEQEHLDFFHKWSSMCALETGEAMKASRLKNLWCQTPQRRESNLSCICKLRVKIHSSSIGDSLVCHTFFRDRGVPTNVFYVGDAVIVSTDTALAMSQGIVRSVDSGGLVISLDRDLKDWSSGDTLFHVDKYEYQQTAGGANLNNLAKLMSNNERAAKLRNIVITGKTDATFLPGLPRDVAVKGKHILRPLNRVQQKAIFKTIMAEEYVLIRGMPGSGKTTAIVALIRLLVALGKSVLLTSYTHSAVDNVLVKLIEQDPDGATPFLRVGQVSRIHPAVLPHSADVLSRNFDGDVTSLKKMFDTRPVVASTCLGINHPAIGGRKFDFCIFDEAGQALLLATLGPLFHCHKFILVGDPQQLPPVVQSSEARKLGLENSLFAHLEKEDNVIPLTLQYRMNSDIQALANSLTYNNQLECGLPQVAEKTLFSFGNKTTDRSWLEKVVDTSLHMSVIFVDTSELGPIERQDDLGICNDLEAEIVGQIYERLGKMSTERDALKTPTIGVIAPYRSQVSNLRKKLFKFVDDPSSVNTVDQFQGRDQDVIIYSCTRCRPQKNDENKFQKVDILSDTRRLNVAVTRAKAKLVIVGHRGSLMSYQPFRELIEYLEKKERVILLNSDDLF